MSTSHSRAKTAEQCDTPFYNGLWQTYFLDTFIKTTENFEGNFNI